MSKGEFIGLVNEANGKETYYIVVSYENAPKILQTPNSKQRGFAVLDSAMDEKKANDILKKLKTNKDSENAYITTDIG